MREEHETTTRHSGTPARTKRALVILAAALGFGLVFDMLFYGHEPGISFPLFTLLALGGVFVAARQYGAKIPGTAYAMALPLMFFSSMIYVRAGGLVSFLNLLATGYLFLLVLRLMYRPNLRRFLPADYLRLFPVVAKRITAKLSVTMQDVSGLGKFAARHPNARQIIRGVAIAAPILVVFGLLFSSADLVFRKYAGEVFGFHINATVAGWTVWGLAVAFVFAGLLSYSRPGGPGDALMASDETAEDEDSGTTQAAEHENGTAAAHSPAAAQPHRTGGLIEAAILFGSLNLMFLLFIVVQVKYLFGGAQNVIGQGFTYAQYARKGFFELLAVAVIAFFLVWVAERKLPRTGRSHSLQFRVLSAALIAQVMVVIVSAFKRMALYESAYGYTSLRVYVQIAIVWLALIFGLLLYKIFVDQRRSTFAFAAFVSVLALLATVNLMNVDGFVAQRNIARYQATGKIDTSYLLSLSEDAVPQTVALLHAKDAEVRNSASDALYGQRLRLQRKENGWQSANVARQAALKALNNNAELLNQRQKK